MLFKMLRDPAPELEFIEAAAAARRNLNQFPLSAHHRRKMRVTVTVTCGYALALASFDVCKGSEFNGHTVRRTIKILWPHTHFANADTIRVLVRASILSGHSVDLKG